MQNTNCSCFRGCTSRPPTWSIRQTSLLRSVREATFAMVQSHFLQEAAFGCLQTQKSEFCSHNDDDQIPLHPQRPTHEAGSAVFVGSNRLRSSAHRTSFFVCAPSLRALWKSSTIMLVLVLCSITGISKARDEMDPVNGRNVFYIGNPELFSSAHRKRTNRGAQCNLIPSAIASGDSMVR